MKKCTLTFLMGLCAAFLFAQSTSIVQWNAILKTAGLSPDAVYKTCNHFPKLSDYSNDDAFTRAVKSWEASYPDEVVGFFDMPEIKAINPSPYYLGLKVLDNHPDEIHSLWQWFQGADISLEELKTFAPNFPTPQKVKNDKALYALEIKRWIYLYGHEYEAFINHPKLTALNPYYKEYVDVVVFPKFMSALVSIEKPKYIDTGNPFEDQLRHDLQMQNWTFVFQPEEFEKRYGFYPEFPEWHPEDVYRAQIIEKIKNNQEAKENNWPDDMRNK